MGDDHARTSFSTDRLQEILETGPPDVPIGYEALQEAARAELSEEVFGFIAGGAGAETTVRRNREAFDRWDIVPRMLRDVSERDLSVEVLGTRLAAPLMLAPIGAQTIIHPDGEAATARAASDLDVPIAVSSAASKSIEEVAEAMDGGDRWFQLYPSDDRELTESLLERAAAAGCSAIVVTVDAPLLGWRERDLQRAYFPPREGHGLGNYFQDPVFRAGLSAPPERDRAAAIERFSEVFSDPSLSWGDLDRLQAMTDLPVLLKGILHPDDAIRAVEAGVDGLVVSNHGGRQVDGAIGAADALPDVVDAVEGRVPVLFDSGIRRGADMFKAIALGADAVFVGRPYLYGLAVDGSAGARAVLSNLLAEFEVTMGLCGCASIDAVRAAELAGPRAGVQG